ncbi:MAG: PD40 domain-containing protein [Proteobacteria bacterium]|nr:PD40 domain-containing protein [Pseudomonadota bacterium]
MLRWSDRWRCVAKSAASLLAALGCAVPAFAQTVPAKAPASAAPPAATLPAFDPAAVAVLAFRPDSADMLLLGVSDSQHGLKPSLVQVTRDGRALLLRTLPEAVASAAWLDSTHIVTGGSDGRLLSWSIDGGGPTVLATVPEPISGIGVAPISHSLVLRLPRTLRLMAPDGRPNGPTITLGVPFKPTDVCPPEGIETTPAFSPDERLLVFVGLCGDLRVTGREGTRLMHVDVPRTYVKRHVFSADGRTLGVAYTAAAANNAPGGGADFWPIAPGRLGNPRALPGPFAPDDPADIAALPAKAGFALLSGDHVRFVTPDGALPGADLAIRSARRLAVSADGTRIAVAAAEGLVLLDGSGQRIVPQPFGDFGQPVAVRSIAGGKQLAALAADGQLRVWGLDGKEAREPLRLWAAQPGTAPAGGAKAGAAKTTVQTPNLYASPSGRRVAVLEPDGQFEIFDEAWKPIGRPIRFPPAASEATNNATLLLEDRVLRPLPDGSGFLIFGFDGRVLGRMTFGGQEKIAPQAAAASAGVIALFADDGRLAAWTLDGKPIRQQKVAVSGIASPHLDISADGKTVVLHDRPRNLPPHLLVWKPAEGGASLENREGAFAGLLADGTLLRVNQRRLVVDGPDGTPRFSQSIDGDRVAAVTPDGKTALVVVNGAVRAVEISPAKR